MKTSTFFSLMAEFQTSQIELDKICVKYFGLTVREAKKRASLNRLPVPAFRCSGQKSSWLIHLQDLADLIDTQRQNAQEIWQKVNN